MDIFLVWFNSLFWFVGLGFSSFYGFKALTVFEVEPGSKPKAWKFHLFWFNFVGSVVGWAVLWVLSRKVWLYLQAKSPDQVNPWDIAFLLVAFVGITRHLPYALFGILRGINELAFKALGLISKSK